MDGLYHHLKHANMLQVTERLKYEEYDTDALLEDVAARSNLDESKSNVAIFAGNSKKSRYISDYVYFTKCMF